MARIRRPNDLAKYDDLDLARMESVIAANVKIVDKCHIWVGKKTTDGRAVIYLPVPKRKLYVAQKVAYLIKHGHGSLRGGRRIRQTCDSLNCVNPDHFSTRKLYSNRVSTRDYDEIEFSEKFKEKFFGSIEQDPAGCHLWKGTKSRSYAVIHIKRVTFMASRIAYMLAHGHGSIPENAFVFHTCFRIDCVNPSHLTLGEKTAFNRLSRLPKEKVDAILQLKGSGMRCAEIADCLGLPLSTIMHVSDGFFALR